MSRNILASALGMLRSKQQHTLHSPTPSHGLTKMTQVSKAELNLQGQTLQQTLQRSLEHPRWFAECGLSPAAVAGWGSSHPLLLLLLPPPHPAPGQSCRLHPWDWRGLGISSLQSISSCCTRVMVPSNCFFLCCEENLNMKFQHKCLHQQINALLSVSAR